MYVVEYNSTRNTTHQSIAETVVYVVGNSFPRLLKERDREIHKIDNSA